MHQTLLCELSNEVDIDGAPGACGLAGSEANCVTGFVNALPNAVDPAEAEGNLYGFGPCDAGFSGTFFVQAYQQFTEFVVMGFEPGTEVRRPERMLVLAAWRLDKLNQKLAYGGLKLALPQPRSPEIQDLGFWAAEAKILLSAYLLVCGLAGCGRPETFH